MAQVQAERVGARAAVERGRLMSPDVIVRHFTATGPVVCLVSVFCTGARMSETRRTY